MSYLQTMIDELELTELIQPRDIRRRALLLSGNNDRRNWEREDWYCIIDDLLDRRHWEAELQMALGLDEEKVLSTLKKMKSTNEDQYADSIMYFIDTQN